MRLFLRAHNAHRAATGSLLLAGISWWLAGTVLPLPQLSQGRGGGVAIELALAAASAPLVAYAFGGPALQLEHGVHRPLWPSDLVLTTVLLCPVVAVAGIAAFSGDTDFAATLLRNTAAFTGLALLALTLAGASAAAAAPVGYFLLISSAGSSRDGTAQWWASFRDPVDSLSFTEGMTLLIAGLLYFHYAGRRRAAAHNANVQVPAAS